MVFVTRLITQTFRLLILPQSKMGPFLMARARVALGVLGYPYLSASPEAGEVGLKPWCHVE